MFGKKKMPVTLEDCISLFEKGYVVEIRDGQVKSIRKEVRG
jgi:hypothetical protein